jgi:hypothetical protein
MWIRGEALKTLLALRGLKQGDRIMVLRDPGHIGSNPKVVWPLDEERETTVGVVRRAGLFEMMCPCGGCSGLAGIPTRTEYVTAWQSPEPGPKV